MKADDADLIQLIQRYSTTFSPETPPLPAAFRLLVGQSLPRQPRAALFDIYGTLFTSGSGDVGTSNLNTSGHAVDLALKAAGAPEIDDPQKQTVVRRFHDLIKADHDTRRGHGTDFPEIEVRDAWRRTLGDLGYSIDENEVEVFAVVFEVTTNPVWPMPACLDVVSDLHRRLPIGIVSNAQFYTPLLFPALLGVPADALGFHPSCVAYSYEHGIAKPSPDLFDGPLAALADQGIDSTEVVYIGNDMLNDVTAAASRSCMTILYAGDTRSLRLRADHPVAGSKKPDAVAQSLTQVATIVLDPKEEP